MLTMAIGVIGVDIQGRIGQNGWVPSSPSNTDGPIDKHAYLGVSFFDGALCVVVLKGN